MHVDCCYCLLFDLALSMVVQFGIVIRIRLVFRLGGAKKILGCSSKTCNEAVRGDMGLDSLSSRRDRAKSKWWHNLCTMIGDTCRYPRQLFDQVWEVKPRRGRLRKVRGKRVDDILYLRHYW